MFSFALTYMNMDWSNVWVGLQASVSRASFKNFAFILLKFIQWTINIFVFRFVHSTCFVPLFLSSLFSFFWAFMILGRSKKKWKRERGWTTIFRYSEIGLKKHSHNWFITDKTPHPPNLLILSRNPGDSVWRCLQDHLYLLSFVPYHLIVFS